MYIGAIHPALGIGDVGLRPTQPMYIHTQCNGLALLQRCICIINKLRISFASVLWIKIKASCQLVIERSSCHQELEPRVHCTNN